MKNCYLYSTPECIRLIEGDKMPVKPERDYRHGTATEYVFKIEYEEYQKALQAAKASSVPIQDQFQARLLIYIKNNSEDIKPDTIYGPFSLRYEIKPDCEWKGDHEACHTERCWDLAECQKELVAILYDDTPVKEQKNDLCAHCNIPIDLHGTCCGWRSAKHPCTPHGIISDQRHPGFGQHFQRYINGTVFGDEDSYEITEVTSFRSGWDLCQKEMSNAVPEKEPQEVSITVSKSAIPKNAKLIEAYETEHRIIVMFSPGDEIPEDHNCDQMGCGSLSHVKYILTKPDRSL